MVRTLDTPVWVNEEEGGLAGASLQTPPFTSRRSSRSLIVVGCFWVTEPSCRIPAIMSPDQWELTKWRSARIAYYIAVAADASPLGPV